MSPQNYLDEKSGDGEDAQLLPTDNSATTPAPSRFSRGKKFRALTVFFFVWIGFFVVSDYVRIQARRLYMTSMSRSILPVRRPRIGSANIHNVSPWEPPIPPDVTLGKCADWQKETDLGRGRPLLLEPFRSSAAFELPIASDKLFVLTRGITAGAIRLGQGGDAKDVQVAVEARYRFPKALDHVKVCLVSKGEGQNGLGIFAPHWNRRNHNGVLLGVTLVLPSAVNGSVLEIKDFETDASLFSHDIGDLKDSVHFDRIHLRSANSPIYVHSLDATNAYVETSNSAIEGDFHSSSNLKLVTSNAPIKVNAELFNDDKGKASELSFGTSNSAIKATLSLHAPDNSGGKFKVAVTSSLGPLDLVVPNAPVRHVLELDARTALSPASVELPSTYQGTFDVTTSLLRPEISWRGDPDDPEGKGRRRRVQALVRGSRASGTVSWSEDKKLPGRVNIETSVSPAKLNLF